MKMGIMAVLTYITAKIFLNAERESEDSEKWPSYLAENLTNKRIIKLSPTTSVAEIKGP